MHRIDRRRRNMMAGLVASAAIVAAPRLQAQSLSSKPVRIVVGFAPGGLTDVVARLMAPTMSQELGQTVVVENKPGAGGNIATDVVAKAAPDGHTLLISNISQIAVNPYAYATLPSNPLTDLSHVGAIAESDIILVVHPSVPANTLAELVQLAKAKPGELNYFTSGAGGLQHVASEAFRMRTGVDIRAVHYRGSGASIPEFLSGQTQMGIEVLPLLEQYVKAGRAKALVVYSTKRSPILPETPTAAEAGYPDTLMTAWLGLHAPKGTPPETIARIERALTKAISNDEVLAKLAASGMRPIHDTPQAFSARIATDSKLYGEAIKAADIRIE
jgi:tripartite-type tricarboxylate transporter receptor subunit TctC